MSGPRIGELFAGYSGLGMGVQAVLGGEIAWYSDVCKFNDDGSVGHYEPHRGACAIMAHHYPGVPNLGDVSAVDWSQVEPIDVLTGGSPCQDLSHAGKRQGMTEGTRSNLWVAMREAIAQLRPSLVVWENVRGAASAPATSDLEFCPGCMGGPRDRGTSLRALGRVVGDLADLSYVGRIWGLRAADVGAPHGRFRYFLAAFPADQRHKWAGASRDGWSGLADGRVGPLLGTPRASEYKGSGPVGSKSHAHMLEREYLSAQVLSLMPTPRASDGTKGGPNQRVSSGDLMLPSAVTLLPTPVCEPDTGNGHARNLGKEVRLLPTPTSMDSRASGGNPNTTGTHGTTLTDATVRQPQDWGIYADAIARWESLTRPAPAPTQPSKKGTPQLSPAFSEWLMGLPAGHVTDVPGLSRNDMLKALGNGVVPQQGEAALRFLLSVGEAAA